MKVVIVGGVAGGATAATRIRRLDESAEIIVIERTGYISYANCGLPYYIGGVIEEAEDLTLQTPESFFRRFQIDVRVRQEVIDIHTEKKTVQIREIESGKIYEESYDKLILSPGARPVRPDLPGIDLERIFSLRTVEDTFQIREFVEKQKPKSAVIVGGGFIGLEVAENLCDLGIQVTIVQRPKQLMNTLDYDMATMVHTKLRSKGIVLKLGGNVTGFEKDAEGIKVLLKEDTPVKADMVLVAIGVSPETTLAEKAGLTLGMKNAIVVNDKMETSVADIYAVGDAVLVKHSVTGADAVISLAGPANKQGRIAADNICGLDSRYKGSMGSSAIKLFDMTAASTGITEKAAKSAGMKANELKDLDLAYAPPFSSAKDPVNMAGFMIENIAKGTVKQFHWDEIQQLQNNGGVSLLDTRTEEEYIQGYVDGFVNIPVDDLRERIKELDTAKPVYVMCQSGLRSYLACRILMQKGFDCYNFSGGYRFYESIYRDKLSAEKSYPCGMDK